MHRVAQRLQLVVDLVPPGHRVVVRVDRGRLPAGAEGLDLDEPQEPCVLPQERRGQAAEPLAETDDELGLG